MKTITPPPVRASLDLAQRVETPHGWAYVASRGELESLQIWANSFSDQRKDHRYYAILEETLTGGFEYHYIVLEDRNGKVRAVQPFFFVEQDLVAGLSGTARALLRGLRSLFPGALRMKMLMVGCSAGEGHLCFTSSEEANWIAESLREVLRVFARRAGASLIVLKEFPSFYRQPLRCFSSDGYARIASMPLVRLGIEFSSFDQYMARVLSRATRKSLRRKFRKAAGTAPIEMEVVNDLTPYVDEVYPLYLEVFERSRLKFEKLTKDYLLRLGQQMPDRARFFVWRQHEKAIAFSVCLVHGKAIYDEYIGLHYPLALELHLYFYTLRDIIQWGMDHGYTTYFSSQLNYDPKLHLRCELVPLDLYVRHTSRILNPFLRKLLPLLSPTRQDAALRRFSNAHDLY